MVEKTPKPGAPTVDARNPDTAQDQPGALPDLDSDAYGFRPIDTEGVVEAFQDGPGVLDRKVVERVDGSTFAERAQTTQKVVTSGSDTVTGK